MKCSEVVADLMPKKKPIFMPIQADYSPQRVIDVVCKHLDIKVAVIKKKGRRRPIVFARQTISYFLFNYSLLYKVQIAELLNQDHTTIIHGLQKFSDYIETEPGTREIIRTIKNKLVSSQD